MDEFCYSEFFDVIGGGWWDIIFIMRREFIFEIEVVFIWFF